MTIPRYSYTWERPEKVIFILDSHMPSQKLGDITNGLSLCCTISSLWSTTTPPSLTMFQPHRLPLFLKEAEFLVISRPLLLPFYLPSKLLHTPSHSWLPLTTQDSAQMSLPQRDLWQLYKKSPLSITYCLIFFITFTSTEIIFYLPPPEYNFHMTGIFFVFIAISLLPNTIPSIL